MLAWSIFCRWGGATLKQEGINPLIWMRKLLVMCQCVRMRASEHLRRWTVWMLLAGSGRPNGWAVLTHWGIQSVCTGLSALSTLFSGFFPDLVQAQLICGEDAIFFFFSRAFQSLATLSCTSSFLYYLSLSHCRLTSFLPLRGYPGHPAAGKVYLIRKGKYSWLNKDRKESLQLLTECQSWSLFILSLGSVMHTVINEHVWT